MCNNLNIVPSFSVIKPNAYNIGNFFQYYSIVNCPFCEYQTKTRRESEYIICPNCKNTVLIIKDDTKIPINANPYTYLKYKIGPIFNPYSRDTNNSVHLKRGFEKEIVENTLSKSMNGELKSIKSSNKANKVKEIFINKHDVYKPLNETIKDITDNINRLNFTGSRLAGIVEKNINNNNSDVNKFTNKYK
jgi:hypothetical protein